MRVANAQDAPEATPMGFPQDEAGISAYFKSTTPVNLPDVRSVFRVIEVETADYIIGSVPVPGYAERYDVHLYVHRDGWFLAYYLSADPASKLFDWNSYTPTSIPTRLERVLAIAANTAGIAFPGSTYYDFRYPNATHLMMIAEDTSDGNSFEVRLPGSYSYYERSWSTHYTGGYCETWFILDGTNIGHNGTAYGSLTAAQLLPETTHTVQISCNGYGGLALIYRVP
ncbi:MAG: hypothetical protein IPM84_23075 [Anaerolineae bacterium]|nr:hypothetical protein [Anaerolineae bacterium]